MNKIPGEDAFSRAKMRMKERDKNLDLVNHALRNRFKEICPDRAHDSHVMAEENSKFRAYIFYKKVQDVQACEDNGISSQLKEIVYDELERQGRGDKASVVVLFELDSDENVQTDFGGDYFLRLR